MSILSAVLLASSLLIAIGIKEKVALCFAQAKHKVGRGEPVQNVFAHSFDTLKFYFLNYDPNFSFKPASPYHKNSGRIRKKLENAGIMVNFEDSPMAFPYPNVTCKLKKNIKL